MTLALCSLSSGSSGNCYLVYSETTAILIDAGISARAICNSLKDLGLEIDRIDAVLVTHEHSDHIKGLEILSRRHGREIYMTKKTYRASGLELAKEPSYINAGESFCIGDITVKSYSLSHDAGDPVGYCLEKDGKKISIVTDTGIVTQGVFNAMQESSILVLESNHDEAILRMGSYPWFLKQRILSEKGHLSNEAAAEAFAKAALEDKEKGFEENRVVLLAHLSQENNFPEMALMTMNNILESHGLKGRDITAKVLPRKEKSPVYIV